MSAVNGVVRVLEGLALLLSKALVEVVGGSVYQARGLVCLLREFRVFFFTLDKVFVQYASVW